MKNIHVVLKNGTPIAAYENEAESKEAMERNGGKYLCQTITIPYIESEFLSETEEEFEDKDDLEQEANLDANKPCPAFVEMIHALLGSKEPIIAMLPLSTMYGDTHLVYAKRDDTYLFYCIKEKLEFSVYTICPVHICEEKNYLEVVEGGRSDFYIITERYNVPCKGTILPISPYYCPDKVNLINHDFRAMTTEFVEKLIESTLITFESPLIGYKLTDPNGCCKNYCYRTDQDEINLFTTEDPIELHKSGFHFATKAITLLGWYRFNKNNRVYRCQVSNAIEDPDLGVAVTDKLLITKQLEWSDVFKDLVQQYED